MVVSSKRKQVAKNVEDPNPPPAAEADVPQNNPNRYQTHPPACLPYRQQPPSARPQGAPRPGRNRAGQASSAKGGQTFPGGSSRPKRAPGTSPAQRVWNGESRAPAASLSRARVFVGVMACRRPPLPPIPPLPRLDVSRRQWNKVGPARTSDFRPAECATAGTSDGTCMQLLRRDELSRTDGVHYRRSVWTRRPESARKGKQTL